MRVGGDHDDGLSEFASESDERPRPARSLARRAVESQRLVPLLVAGVAIGYGGLMVLRWERDSHDIKPSFSAAPTTSFRPIASAPEPKVPASTRAPEARRPADARDDVFVPAVARADSPARPTEAAAALPEPVPATVPDAAEDVVPPLIPSVATVPFDQPAAVSPPAVAAVTAAPRAPEPVVVDPIAADRAAIGDVLQSYRTAYNALDATSVSTFWQGLDTRALQRAFATLSQQDVTFDRCDVRLTGQDRAAATCRGVLRYVPRIGDAEPQQRRLAWYFDFQRAAGRWLIASVSAR
jgi:hypothetical protein